ncbi:uncharacterized protein [Misgurnus anguillicaudatus]|uniref:uncharacterized protein n=1 Tax=Misgurnus anguillicaudatus TaxID=75329 RepID=UPI003CCFC4FB
MAGCGVVWSYEESCALIDIWKEDGIKRQLFSTHKNIKVFLLFSQKLKERGYNRTALQCRVKVKKLRQKYMNTRDKMRRSGESAEIKDSCPFYDDLNEILGASACACPADVVEGGSVDLQNEEEEEFDRCSSVTDSSTASENNHYGDDMTTADTPSHTRQPSVENRQTRRPSIKGTVTEVTSMLSSMIDQQKQYFELFATGEEERHRRELELERERFRLQIELEDRRRQTQMEHDQAMLRMMAQVISASTHTAPSQTPFPAPIYTPEHSTTLHQLTPAHHSNQGFAVYNQEDSTDAASQVPLSSVLHEINKFK